MGCSGCLIRDGGSAEVETGWKGSTRCGDGQKRSKRQFEAAAGSTSLASASIGHKTSPWFNATPPVPGSAESCAFRPPPLSFLSLSLFPPPRSTRPRPRNIVSSHVPLIHFTLRLAWPTLTPLTRTTNPVTGSTTHSTPTLVSIFSPLLLPLPPYPMLPSIFLSLALFVLDAAAAAPPQRREPLHIPVVRRHSARRGGKADMDRFAAAAHRLKGKYGYPRSAVSRRATTTDVGITNQVTLPL